MTTSAVETDVCYRCDYNLRGIADDQPCPECGLLAIRSRRQTDELHNTRPKWLWSISRGVWLILLGIVIPVCWFFVWGVIERGIFRSYLAAGLPLASIAWRWLGWIGLDAGASVLIVGIYLLTRPEGYEPADKRDRWRRCGLRVFAFSPLLAALCLQLLASGMPRGMFVLPRGTNLSVPLGVLCTLFGTILSSPLPLLLFFQLRGIARRARSAHLAEHCAIVGIGASCGLLYFGIVIALFANAERLRLGDDWTSRSTAALWMLVAVGAAAGLFILWSIYLLTRFAISFHRAARRMGTEWKRDDRAG
ncbi:MAG: hypothetical protein ACREJC_10755 [Tepidisphaeraceae bacterium]